MKYIQCLIIAAFLLITSNETCAQSRDQQLRAYVDSVLTTRYYRSPYDTAYVVRPEGKLTLKVRMNQTGNDFHAKGTVNDIYSKADLKTSHKTTFSVVGNYRGIGVGVAINPAKWKGIYKDYEQTHHTLLLWPGADWPKEPH